MKRSHTVYVMKVTREFAEVVIEAASAATAEQVARHRAEAGPIEYNRREVEIVVTTVPYSPES